MTIELDWQVEPVDGEAGPREAVYEDPEAVAARLRRARRTRILLGVVALTVLLMGGGAMWRVRQVDAQLRAALASTVAAESLALRIGDREAFLRAQSPASDWRSQQTLTFERYVFLSRVMEIGAEPDKMAIDGSEATVEMPVTVEGKPAPPAIWRYRYAQKEGWRHVASEDDPWDFEAVAEGQFSFHYRGLESSLVVGELQNELPQWWRRAGSLLGVEPNAALPAIDGWLIPSLSQTHWANADQTILLAPAPRGDAEAAALRSTLAEALAGRLVVAALERPSAPAARWVDQEIAAALRHSFDPHAPDAAILGPLLPYFGKELLRTFAAYRSVDGRHVGDEALMAAMKRGWSDAHSNSQYQDGAPQPAYFQAYLQAEAALRAWERENVHMPENLPWQADTAFLLGEVGYGQVRQPLFSQADPESIEVLSVEREGRNAFWVQVRFTALPSVSGGKPHQVTAYLAFQSFNFIGRIRPESMGFTVFPRAWDQTISGEKIDLTFRDNHEKHPDALLAAPTQTLDELESVYAGAQADLGLREAGEMTAPHIALVVYPAKAPENNGAADPPITLNLDPYVIRTDCHDCYAGDPIYQNAFRDWAARALIRALVRVRMGLPPRSAYTTPLVEAATRWEARRLDIFVDDLGYFSSYHPRPAAIIPDSPADSWNRTLPLPPGVFMVQGEIDILAAETLLNALVEQYGAESMPGMLGAYARLASTDDPVSLDVWLSESLDITMADVIDEWRAAFAATLREIGW
jgi:hypothetical protein